MNVVAGTDWMRKNNFYKPADLFPLDWDRQNCAIPTDEEQARLDVEMQALINMRKNE